MKIRYSLSRADVFFAGLQLMARNWILILFYAGLSVFVFFQTFNLPSRVPQPLAARIFGASCTVAVFLCAIGGAVVLVHGLSILVKKLDGVVGEHTLEVTEEGMVERTAFNETVFRWQGFRPIRRSSTYFYLRPNDTMYFQIPRRPGAVEGDLDGFLREIAARAGK